MLILENLIIFLCIILFNKQNSIIRLIFTFKALPKNIAVISHYFFIASIIVVSLSELIRL